MESGQPGGEKQVQGSRFKVQGPTPKSDKALSHLQILPPCSRLLDE
jgi:hypothetical protein